MQRGGSSGAPGADPAAEAIRLLNSARPQEAAEKLLEAGELALSTGDPETARAHLDKAAGLGLPDAMTPRMALAYAEVNRYLGKHKDTLAWISKRLAREHSPETRAVLLRAKITTLRGIDTQALLDQASEALEAAEAVDDMESYAAILMSASFAAYRRGDAKTAGYYADLALSREFESPHGAINALRCQMFAATAGGALERALGLSREVRNRWLDLDHLGNAANECNNIGETLLELGRAAEARMEAEKGAELAIRSGHRAVEHYSRVLIAASLCETGDEAEGIEALRRAASANANVALASDAAVALAFWLVERNEKGDAAEARAAADKAIERAASAGISHLLTTLLALRARAEHRLGDREAARESLARARSAAERADTIAEKHLGLAILEIYDAGDPARKVVVNQTRAKILRTAGRREDPHAYCTGNRLHRKILEASGGVPPDLPRG